MSTWYTETVSCPRCAVANDVSLLHGAYVGRLPEVKRAIREGHFQRFACTGCKAEVRVEAPLVYTDLPQGQYIAVEPPATPDWRAARRRHVEVFDGAFVLGPPCAERLAHGMRHRMVLGVDALREKVLLWDAGLDDRVVEAVKHDVLVAEGTSPSTHLLRVVAILDGGHLLCRRTAVPIRSGPVASPTQGPRADTIILPAAAYARRQAASNRIATELPWLADDWVVDLWLGTT